MVCQHIQPSPGEWWRCFQPAPWRRLVAGRVRWYCDIHRDQGEPALLDAHGQAPEHRAQVQEMWEQLS